MATQIKSPLTYDYFCKRSENIKETSVYLSENQEDIATLCEYTYSSNIINLKECFYKTKFVNCKNWFDETDNDNYGIITERNYILLKSGEKCSERGKEYYTHNIVSGTYTKHILNNDIIDDCKENYTDFVPNNKINSGDNFYTWNNHDLLQDFIYYGNIKKCC